MLIQLREGVELIIQRYLGAIVRFQSCYVELRQWKGKENTHSVERNRNSVNEASSISLFH